MRMCVHVGGWVSESFMDPPYREVVFRVPQALPGLIPQALPGFKIGPHALRGSPIVNQV